MDDLGEVFTFEPRETFGSYHAATGRKRREWRNHTRPTRRRRNLAVKPSGIDVYHADLGFRSKLGRLAGEFRPVAKARHVDDTRCRSCPWWCDMPHIPLPRCVLGLVARKIEKGPHQVLTRSCREECKEATDRVFGVLSAFHCLRDVHSAPV